jgi:hypothetical protein
VTSREVVAKWSRSARGLGVLADHPSTGARALNRARARCSSGGRAAPCCRFARARVDHPPLVVPCWPIFSVRAVPSWSCAPAAARGGPVAVAPGGQGSPRSRRTDRCGGIGAPALVQHGTGDHRPSRHGRRCVTRSYGVRRAETRRTYEGVATKHSHDSRTLLPNHPTRYAGPKFMVATRPVC